MHAYTSQLPAEKFQPNNINAPFRFPILRPLVIGEADLCAYIFEAKMGKNDMPIIA